MTVEDTKKTKIQKLLEVMREYELRESDFHDMEIGFLITPYRNIGDALDNIAHVVEKLLKLFKAPSMLGSF